MQTQSRIKVWDPLVRVFHWTLVTAFAIAFVTEDDFLSLHVLVGYTIVGLLAVRLVWGLVGTRYARFTNFVYRPATVKGYLKDVARFRARRYLGHNPAGGAMVIALLLMLVLTSFTGLLTYGAEERAGPLVAMAASLNGHWLEEIHEFLANATLALVVLHVAGVIIASLQHRENLVASMVNGLKRKEVE
ncbi:MAG: cytochrome b/b6 domain-containing protein [Gammaproteobacteria bacterium]|nr:cytochrome b/b6 domain-containing protein [Gammaproteobacteria bacterium]